MIAQSPRKSITRAFRRGSSVARSVNGGRQTAVGEVGGPRVDPDAGSASDLPNIPQQRSMSLPDFLLPRLFNGMLDLWNSERLESGSKETLGPLVYVCVFSS